MSIYNSSFNFAGKWGKQLLLALAVIVIIVLAFLSFSQFFQPSAISYSFSPSELDFSNGKREIVLNVSVTNITGQDSAETTVKVEPADPSSIEVFPAERKIGLLPKGETRELKAENGFLLKPSPLKEALLGTYTIRITALVSNKTFSGETVLNVK